jgi:catechol 2,3-dioxygenase-like lactoylglutathione lyase family enzyme
MQFHVGRLIDHVHLRVSDLDASKRFYRAVFVALGKVEAFRKGNHFADELWVDKAGGHVSRVHYFAPDLSRDGSTQPQSPLEVATTALRASAAITLATTARSCSTPMATTSKLSFMGRPIDRPRPW